MTAPLSEQRPRSGLAGRWWRKSLLAGAMLGLSAGAFAATDITVNQEACDHATEPTTCPNSLEGPAGGDVTFTAKIIWNTGENPGGVTLTDTLPLGAKFQSFEVPAGVTCLPALAPNTLIDANNQVIECTGITFADGETGDSNAKRVGFKVTLPTVSTGWNNHAKVQSTVADSNTTNDLIGRGYTTTEAADLQVGVVTTPTHDGSSPLDPGTPYTQTVTVTNNGPTGIPSAGRVTVSFEVPSQSHITGVSGNGWNCSPNPTAASPQGAGTTITCTRNGALASGASNSNLEISGVSNATNGSATTQFTVLGYKASGDNRMPDGQPDNNTAPGVVYTSGENTADLGITKTLAGNATRPLGEQITYTLTPRFLGGNLPVGAVIRVTDTVAAGLTLDEISSSDSAWTCNTVGAYCTYTVPDPAPANFTNLPTITAKATVTATGLQANTASIKFDSGATDPNSANNESSVNVTGSDSANLAMTKTASNYQQGVNVAVPIGEIYQYTLSVRNGGPLAIPAADGNNPAVEITESVPDGVVIEGIHTANDWSCPALSSAVTGPTTFTCTYSGGFTNGQTHSLVLNAKRTTTDNATNNACTKFGDVSGAPTRQDPNMDNNCDGVAVGASNSTDPTNPVQADLKITKTASGPVFAGENLVYTLRVQNLSNTTPAENVTLIDNMGSLVGSGHSLLSITDLQSGQTCTPAAPSSGVTRNLSCSLGTLAANHDQTITVTVRPNVAEVGEMRSNTAYVFSATTVDPALTNNQSTTTSQVTARVDLTASKTVATSEGGSAGGTKNAAAGSKMDYVVRAINAGPSSAENVWLRDPLPTQAILVGTPNALSGGVCQVVSAATSAGEPVMDGGTTHPASAPGGVLECMWDSTASPSFLANGGQREVQYSLRSVPGTPVDTKLDNTVTVGTKTDEPNKDNNTASAKVTLTKEELDLTIQMSHDQDGLPLGDVVRYTITVRHASGPTFATNVRMKDIFPTTNEGGDPSSATFAYIGNLAVSDPAATCDEPDDGATAGELECVFPVLAPGETRTISFDMRASGMPLGAMSGTIFHHATVEADEEEWLSDPNQDAEENNDTRDLTSTNRADENADLSVQKTVNVEQLLPGGEAIYTLTVTNHGPAASNGAQLADTLPAGLSFVSSSDGCVEADGVVSCAVGALANGASKAFSFTVQVDQPFTQGSSVINRAEVDAPGDPNPGNNEDDEETPVDQTGYASIHGCVFHDVNNDGNRDAGEPAIPGVTITLRGEENGVQIERTAVTGPEGCYEFTGLLPGVTYTVTETQPPASEGWIDGKDKPGTVFEDEGGGANDSYTVTPKVDEHGKNWNFGEVKQGDENASICGKVYHDANNNGQWDEGEEPIEGVTIELWQGGVRIAETTTDEDGNYCFTELPAGTYEVREIQPKGWNDGKDNEPGDKGGTQGPDEFTEIVLEAGDEAKEYNFGEIKPDVTPVPTLSQWSLVVLSLMMLAMLYARRRQAGLWR